MNHGYISRYLAIALASALVLVACGGGSDTPRTAAPADTRARDASGRRRERKASWLEKHGARKLETGDL